LNASREFGRAAPRSLIVLHFLAVLVWCECPSKMLKKYLGMPQCPPDGFSLVTNKTGRSSRKAYISQHPTEHNSSHTCLAGSYCCCEGCHEPRLGPAHLSQDGAASRSCPEAPDQGITPGRTLRNGELTPAIDGNRFRVPDIGPDYGLKVVSKLSVRETPRARSRVMSARRQSSN